MQYVLLKYLGISSRDVVCVCVNPLVRVLRMLCRKVAPQAANGQGVRLNEHEIDANASNSRTIIRQLRRLEQQSSLLSNSANSEAERPASTYVAHIARVEMGLSREKLYGIAG